jgi:hypothetical protein
MRGGARVSKEGLHQLIDALPESELDKAARLLAALETTDPVLRALLLAPEDDEPETDEERAAVDEAREAARRGEVFTLEEVERELGLLGTDRVSR